MKIVLATGNTGKIKEFAELFKSLPIEIQAQNTLGVSEIEETGLSFIENAILKARHASKVTQLPALADDSGLTVNALQGRPGIYSARYAGTHASAQDNIEKLLTEMQAYSTDERDAQFHCVLAFLIHEFDATPCICYGTWSGRIAMEKSAQPGFGYDPIFYVPTENQMASELTLQRKNEISHRGIAFRALFKTMQKIILRK